MSRKSRKFVREHVADLNGVKVRDITWKDEENEIFGKQRSFGRRSPTEELQDKVKTHKSSSGEFYVVTNAKNRSREPD